MKINTFILWHNYYKWRITALNSDFFFTLALYFTACPFCLVCTALECCCSVKEKVLILCCYSFIWAFYLHLEGLKLWKWVKWRSGRGSSWGGNAAVVLHGQVPADRCLSCLFSILSLFKGILVSKPRRHTRTVLCSNQCALRRGTTVGSSGINRLTALHHF